MPQSIDNEAQGQVWEDLLNKIFGLYPMAASLVAPDLLKELEDLKVLVKENHQRHHAVPAMEVPLKSLLSRLESALNHLPQHATTVRGGGDEIKGSLAAADKKIFIAFLFELAALILVEYDKYKISTPYQ